MAPKYDKIHNRFKLNDNTYCFEELKEVGYSLVKEGLPYEKIIGDFLIDWLDGKDHILAETSGSTGKPKTIKLKKQAMVHSAIATGDFFNLKPGDSALHCLPCKYIAGKMMLVRAMILGLEIDLVEPTSQPIFDYERKYDFCAMVPLQLEKITTYCNNIKTIIVGGSSVSTKLKDAIQDVKTNVFETYGMTETITHIAVKKLNNWSLQKEETKTATDALFKILPNITISQDERNCLVIDAPKISKTKIITNDVVKMHSKNSFEWLGRVDNVINSGGIKFFPEQLEAKLQTKIANRFFITKEADEKLGECIVLIVESKTNTVDPSVFSELEKFEIPKKIYSVEKFIESENGKMLRQQTLKKLK
ncbi:AMP-binding protein [Lacinutrix sp. C3R15]|uniref:AMP-binding protein n=1 Tax=Flavobacteriaceae TaxID=49546 RepID=UPI001C09AC8F|nr:MULTISPECIES: AMP-binding protein [Flavobacteriaceae]MBU2938750.1 AMP-binding protein [Lacinutrix sp. C3R15]MDO6622063.1 AMP-binding protein [Oceanihabitans sp. 1_MG-2023]